MITSFKTQLEQILSKSWVCSFPHGDSMIIQWLHQYGIHILINRETDIPTIQIIQFYPKRFNPRLINFLNGVLFDFNAGHYSNRVCPSRISPGCTSYILRERVLAFDPEFDIFLPNYYLINFGDQLFIISDEVEWLQVLVADIKLRYPV